MKKSILKLSFAMLLTFCLIASIFSMNCFAAKGDTSLSFSNKVIVGNNVTVTVTITGNQMTIANLRITYDSSILKYVSGADIGGGGVASLLSDFSSTSRKSFSISFTTLKAGSCVIAVSGTKCETPECIESSIEGASYPIQVMDAALSTNTNLKSLTVNQGKLSPSFSAGRTSYTVNVKNSVTTCQISAVAADSGAKVAVYPANNTALKVGTNTRTVTVTAPSGNTKKYTVNIIRSETDDVVSSDADTTSSETPTEDPLLIMNGSFASYTVLSDLTGITLLKGFTATEAQHNGAAISVATDEKGEYKLYYLKSPEGDETVICTYDEDTKTFKKVSYIAQGNYTHIVAELPEGYNLPSTYFTTNAKIGNFDIKCYGSTSSDEFYYIYCYTNGTYGFYRYDTVEGVLQRFPELRPTQAVVTVPEEKEEYNFAERFNSLTSNSKIILVCLVAIALAIIAIIVLLIVKLATRKKVKDANNFDDFDINDTFYITDSEDNDSDESEE